MLRDEFDFVLDKSIVDNQEDSKFVFHAKAWSTKSYDVTFLYDWEVECVGYSRESVEEYVKEGKWIIID